jgi:MSHA biogenesis protein MshQ
MLALALGAFSPQALAQDPVAFWQMDEDQWNGTSGEVTDSSGNGNNGTARTAGSSGSFPDTVDAKVCQGGRFRGWGFNDPEENNAYYQAQHYVDVPDSDELSPLATTGEMSISGWVRLDDRRNTQPVVHKGANEQEYSVAFENGRPVLTVWDAYGGSFSLSLNYRISEDEWYFFNAQAQVEDERQCFLWWCSWDYSVDLQLTLFAENGNVVASDNDSEDSRNDISYTSKSFNAPLIFGGIRYGSGDPSNFLNGTLDELYIHDTELTTNEARDLALNTRLCSSPGSFTCEPENFDRTGLGDDWVTDSSSGSFTPQIVAGRLRMTEAVGNQATAATYQRTFPGSDNLIQVEFDYYAYDGSGADGLAVVFSDASVTPQAGGYGGSLGYAQEPDSSGGFAGGWLGIGLDEYGNFSNDSEGRNGGNNGRTLDSVAVRGAAETDYEYITDSGTLSPGIDSNNDNNPFRYRITIDSRGGQTPVLTVERKRSRTGQSFTEVLTAALTDQPPMPTNMFLSLTGSTGGSTNIHELDNLQICAEKIGPVQELVDHFEIEHSGTGLTCSPEEITIRACDNADCSQPFPDPVKVTMSPSGWLGGDTFTFTGAVTTKLQVTNPGTVTLDVISSDPGAKAFSQTLCDNGSGGLSADNCDMTFFDSGFDISIPDHVSDTTVQATIAAIKTDDVTEQCVPGFSEENKPVALWSDYVNPSSGSRNVFVDEDPVPGSLGDTSSLYFDENGEATVDVRYPDVGRVRLRARHDGEDDEEGLVMFGDGTFVARPDRFELAASILESGGRRDNPAATDADGPVFVAAGQEFDIEVAALNASGNITPNFGREVIPEGVRLDIELVKPSGAGAEKPPLNGSFGDFGEDCDENTQAGVACGQFQWPEVGIIRIAPLLASGSYLSTEDVVGDAVPHVGRFVPDHFTIEDDEPGSIKMTCETTDFTYSGQPTSWAIKPSVKITPRNALESEGKTHNYLIGGFWKLRDPGQVELGAWPDTDAEQKLKDQVTPYPVNIEREDENAALYIEERDDEKFLIYELPVGDRILYRKEADHRIASFNPVLKFQIEGVEDYEGITDQLPEDTPFEMDTESAGEIYYGRLVAEDVYGAESDTLEMSFQAEYWDGTNFVVNEDDSCTGWSTTEIENAEEYHSMNPDSGSFDGGQGGPLELKGTGQGYDILIWKDIWWWADFDGNGFIEAPSATATFGVYRGNDRIIYWQEVLN